jgi:heptaprenyl diphosphate synthase
MKKTVTLALLTAVSLILFIVEMQIPPIIPIGGVKIGLANMVTLFILYNRRSIWCDALGAPDAVLVVIARVLLAGLVTGSLFSLMFSFAGGITAVFTMLLFRKILRGKLIPVVSVAGALAHNTAQIAVAVLVYGGFGVLLYFPALVLSGILSGLITGFAAAIILKRMKI